MAVCFTKSFIYLLLAFGGFVAALQPFKTKYIEYGLDNEAICNPVAHNIQNVDNLKKNKDSAIIVKPSHTFTTWLVNYNKICRFKIRSAKEMGLFAVIQRMSLRRNGTGCLDYVQFQAENLDEKEPHISEKYCGKLYIFKGVERYFPNMNAKDYEYVAQSIEEDSNENFKQSFEISSTAGKITTEIFISKQPIKSGEILDLLITYTPFRDCNASKSTGFHWFKHAHFKSFCINDEYNCDHFRNCVSGMCSDETKCTYPDETRIVSDETGTKVTVSAVTTIILCFIIFVLCIWICRKHKKLCWSSDCTRPSSSISSNNAGMPMEPNQQSTPNPPLVSSVPMLEVAVPTSQDKDLPPTYDSLFPTQQNTDTTTANT
ncbi:uncharacterized protein LOC131675657 [Phymastichus coffea]|uniref:uncharacterized protein LOC131675657 n=1 Tax=Phymastichus coffea TaxID=108790 RepID=UPI00273B9581|nr:uncharacterized protein LOC131675657 [Phymastichus coffea]XP_058810688.1 uncharacterized protein LOC131675657 [Phymastichus coffea]